MNTNDPKPIGVEPYRTREEWEKARQRFMQGFATDEEIRRLGATDSRKVVFLSH